MRAASTTTRQRLWRLTGDLMFLGRRSQGMQARGAKDSTRGTDKRRARRILPRAASAGGGARLRRAGAGGGQGHEGISYGDAEGSANGLDDALLRLGSDPAPHRQRQVLGRSTLGLGQRAWL